MSDQGGGKTARFLRQKKRLTKEKNKEKGPQKLEYSCNIDIHNDKEHAILKFRLR